MVGTKCNHLLLLNTRLAAHHTHAESGIGGSVLQDVALPTVAERPGPEQAETPASYLIRASPVQDALWSIASQQRRESDTSGIFPDQGPIAQTPPRRGGGIVIDLILQPVLRKTLYKIRDRILKVVRKS